MTVPVQTPYDSYSYSGPGDYNPDFFITDEHDIEVRHIKEDGTVYILEYGSDFTVSFQWYSQPTVTVLYDDQPYGGTLEFLRSVKVDQETDWLNQGPFDQELIEKNLDKLTMLVQDAVFQFVSMEGSKWRGEWQPITAYEVKDMISGPSGTPYEVNVYMATITHTSSDDFEDDLDNGYWQVVIALDYLYDLVIRAEQAAQEALGYRDEAQVARNEAENYAAAASGHADDAEQYAIQAGQYVGQASQWADKASQWSDNPVDDPVENGRYSAYHWAQKAAEYGGINQLTSSDTDMILVQTDATDPKHKILYINSDISAGIPKLDLSGRIKKEQLPASLTYFVGPYRGDDTCPKPGDDPGDCVDPDYRNPSQRWPTVQWPDGAYFIISSDGHVEVNDGSGGTVVQEVFTGDALIYVNNGVVLPNGWYYLPGNQRIELTPSGVRFFQVDNTDRTPPTAPAANALISGVFLCALLWIS